MTLTLIEHQRSRIWGPSPKESKSIPQATAWNLTPGDGGGAGAVARWCCRWAHPSCPGNRPSSRPPWAGWSWWAWARRRRRRCRPRGGFASTWTAWDQPCYASSGCSHYCHLSTKGLQGTLSTTLHNKNEVRKWFRINFLFGRSKSFAKVCCYQVLQSIKNSGINFKHHYFWLPVETQEKLQNF